MKLNHILLQSAAREGIVTPAQAEQLWQFFQEQGQNRASLRFNHMLYYLGGMLAIGAMTLFMTLGWERFAGGGLLAIALVYAAVGIASVEYLLFHRQLPVPAAIMATFVISLTPLAVFGLLDMLGWWEIGHSYRHYYRYVDWHWLTMELSTLCVAGLLLYRYRQPFLVMPVAFTLWYMSMDLPPFFYEDNAWGWEQRYHVSLWFGLLILAGTFITDYLTRRGEKDYAFWLYISGVVAFWGGLTLLDSDSELNKFLYCCINLLMIITGTLIQRRVFVIFGALGVAAYLGHLAYQVFADSVLFPFILTLIGFSLIFAGILWQRNEHRINTWARRKMGKIAA